MNAETEFLCKWGVDYTKPAIANALEHRADVWARKNSISFNAAYAEVLKTDEGRELYAAHSRAPEGAAPVTKASSTKPAEPERGPHEQALEAFVRQEMQTSGATYPAAMAKVLETPAGRAAYAGMRNRI
jgi:hypothetical protein